MKNTATRYTIRTESQPSMDEETVRLASGYFKGFTLLWGTGCYEGEHEASLSIIILATPDNVIRFPDDADALRSIEFYIKNLAAAIDAANEQDCCLIEAEEVTYEFI